MLNLLQIRPGEGRPALLLVLLMLIPSAGGAISSAAIDALFFARVGVKYLPYMYMLLGVVTLAASLVVTGLLGRFPQRRLYPAILLTLGLSMLAARTLISLDMPWVYSTLWLAMYLMWTVQYLVIWGLASMVFDTRQAKRLFPLFAAGGILGSAIGGLITRPLVSVVGAENLLLAWAIAFGIATVLVRSFREAGLEKPAPRRRRGSLIGDLQRGYLFVRRSELMRWMSWSALLLGLLLFVVIFGFSRAVARAFPDENEIAGFLGQFVAIATVDALLASLLVASRLFGRVGFMGGLLAFPVIYLAGFAVLAVWPVFVAFAALRFAQVVWRLGVADPAFQGVFNLVPPDLREPTRAFIDGVPRQAGVVLAGVLLLLGESALRPVHTYLLGAGLSGLCLYVAWRAQGAYRAALAEALRSGRPQVFFPEDQPFGGFRSDASAVAVAIDGVADPDPLVRQVAVEILGNLQLPEATQALVAALPDPDPGVRAAVLRSLGKAGATAASAEVAALLHDTEPEVRLRALQALRDLASSPADLRARLEDLLQDPAAEVRGWAAVVILQSGDHSAARETVRLMLNAADPRVRVVVPQALAAWGTSIGFELAASSLHDPHPAVRRAATTAIASSALPEGLTLLTEALDDEDQAVRRAVADALANYGRQAVLPVLEALQHLQTESGALLAFRSLPIGEVSVELGHYALSKQERALAYHDLWRGLKGIPRPGERSALLFASIRDAARRQAHLAIEAVGILHDSTAAWLAIENLESEDRAQQANALEIVDSLGDRKITGPLLNIWDPAPHDGEPRLEPLECVERALHDGDAWLRACAALAAVELRDPNLEPSLRELADGDPDPLVRDTALAALNGEPTMESLPTLSIMERILFLRRVPLFAHLPPNELKQIAGIARELVFAEGEVIAAQGEQGDEMFIIAEGEVRVVAEDVTGAIEELAHRQPGEYVGEMAIISREPRMASLLARGEVRTLCIGQKEFEGILRERPETSLSVMRELITRLRATQADQVA